MQTQSGVTCQRLPNGQDLLACARSGRNGKSIGVVYGILTTRRVIGSKGVSQYRSTLTVTNDPKGVHGDPTETHYHTYSDSPQGNYRVLHSFFRLNYASTVNRPPIELCQFSIQMLGSCNFVIKTLPREKVAAAVEYFKDTMQNGE